MEVNSIDSIRSSRRKRWYVLYTTPRSEKLVQQRIVEVGVEVFLPMHVTHRKWSDRVKMVEAPLFPSYVFVHANDPKLRSLLKINGVVRIVYHNGRPAVIREREINAIRTFLENARDKELVHEIGDELLIACGPFSEISGKVKKIKKSHLLLHLEQLGCTVCVPLTHVVKKKVVV